MHGSDVEHGLSTGFGTVMALIGIAVAVLGAWRYAVTDRGLRRGYVTSLSTSMGYTVALLVVAVGVVVAFALMSYR